MGRGESLVGGKTTPSVSIAPPFNLSTRKTKHGLGRSRSHWLQEQGQDHGGLRQQDRGKDNIRVSGLQTRDKHGLVCVREQDQGQDESEGASQLSQSETHRGSLLSGHGVCQLL